MGADPIEWAWVGLPEVEGGRKPELLAPGCEAPVPLLLPLVFVKSDIVVCQK